MGRVGEVARGRGWRLVGFAAVMVMVGVTVWEEASGKAEVVVTVV